MPRFRNFQSNFTGGLLSEGMLGRVDLAQYENGCKQLTNWWPKVTGGCRRRPGSVFLTYCYGAARIESFIFNEDQTYVVAFYPSSTPLEGKSAFPANNIKIFDPLTGDPVDTLTWTLLSSPDVIDELSITQAGDVMFVASEFFQTIKIVRTGASTFEIQTFEFDDHDSDSKPIKSPFIKFADGDITLESSGHTGSVTLTTRDATGAAYPFFYGGHTGLGTRRPGGASLRRRFLRCRCRGAC